MILINGQTQDTLTVLDRGLQYGDGLFETLAIVDGRPLHWEAHLNRLQQGCSRLAIPPVDEAALLSEAESLCDGQSRAVLKIIVTRGAGGRGYRAPQPARPTRILQRHPWPDYPDSVYREGIQVRYCQTTLACNPALAGIKHLNRLEQVLARNEWDDESIHEGLMCNRAGDVIEGTMSNLFMVSGNQLYTPALDACGVAGIMRQTVIDWCGEHGLSVSISRIDRDALHQADEVFLTNSLIGIWPVKCIDKHTYAIGPLTVQLVDAMQEMLGG